LLTKGGNSLDPRGGAVACADSRADRAAPDLTASDPLLEKSHAIRTLLPVIRHGKPGKVRPVKRSGVPEPFAQAKERAVNNTLALPNARCMSLATNSPPIGGVRSGIRPTRLLPRTKIDFNVPSATHAARSSIQQVRFAGSADVRRLQVPLANQRSVNEVLHGGKGRSTRLCTRRHRAGTIEIPRSAGCLKEDVTVKDS